MQKRILIIDDDDSIRESLVQALEFEGYEVASACNGQEGLEILQQFARPRLILLDLMMPVMNGWEFAEAMKKDAMLADIPIVAITAYKDMARDIQVNEILQKPVSLELLYEMIERFCR